MKRTHYVNPNWTPKPEPISERYQAEVDASVRRSEAAYRSAERAVHAAEQRLAKARQIKAAGERKRAVRGAEQALADRSAELVQLAYAMQASPAGTQHRGRGAYRPLPQPKVM